jgi:hypothetical protein
MPPAKLPDDFDAELYIDLMSPVVGLDLDAETKREVAKLLKIAHSMASVVYQAPLDDNLFDIAGVFTPGGRKHD